MGRVVFSFQKLLREFKNLAGKRKNSSPTKKKDPKEAGPTLSNRPWGSTLSKRPKTISVEPDQKKKRPKTIGLITVEEAHSTKIFLLGQLRLELVIRFKPLRQSLGKNSGVNSNSQLFRCESFLDHSRQNTTCDQPNLNCTSSTPGTSENPNALENSPDKTNEPVLDTLSCSTSCPRRNPEPLKFYGERHFIQQVLPLAAAIEVVDLEEDPLIVFISTNGCQATNTFEPPQHS